MSLFAACDWADQSEPVTATAVQLCDILECAANSQSALKLKIMSVCISRTRRICANQVRLSHKQLHNEQHNLKSITVFPLVVTCTLMLSGPAHVKVLHSCQCFYQMVIIWIYVSKYVQSPSCSSYYSLQCIRTVNSSFLFCSLQCLL